MTNNPSPLIITNHYHHRTISVALLNLSLHLAAETSPYAWLMTNVHFVLLMMVSYELERRDLQVPTHSHLLSPTHTVHMICHRRW